MIRFKKPYKDEAVKETVKTFDPIIEKIDGRNVLVYKERVDDPNKGLSYVDFSLRSLMDADAVDLLQPTNPIQRSALYAADVASVIADNISNTSSDVEENNEIKNVENNE